MGVITRETAFPSDLPHTPCSQHTCGCCFSVTELQTEVSPPHQRHGHDYILHRHTWICTASYPAKPHTLPVLRQQESRQHPVPIQAKQPLPLRRAERGMVLCQCIHLSHLRPQPPRTPLLCWSSADPPLPEEGPEGEVATSGGGGTWRRGSWRRGAGGRGCQASSSRVYSINL